MAYIDFKLLGTHEKHSAGRAEVLARSILDHGYYGPPIAVFQYGSDELYINNPTFETLRPNVSYGDLGVADGHHRLAAIASLNRLGLLRERVIPVQLIPAHDAEKIRNITVSIGVSPLTITEIEKCFHNPNQKLPFKSTYFHAKLESGEWVPIKESQPDLIIDRSKFLQDVRQTA